MTRRGILVAMGYQRYEAHFDLDGSTRFAAWACYLIDNAGRSVWRPATENHRAVVSRIRQGESFEALSFEYWRAFLEERGGAAVIELIADHLNPPDFPCPPEGCPQHPYDEYEEMSRNLEHWLGLRRMRVS